MARIRSGNPMTDVVTTGGRVSGVLAADSEMAHWFGIPYAAPPVADRRWRPPAQVEPWRGTLKAKKHGPVAWQRSAQMESFITELAHGLGLGPARRRALLTALKVVPVKQDEDCLTVNVRAPAGASGLPVMVWIHGGDHTDGSGGELVYQSDALPERGCVLVTFNYRLGLMGFFAHPELSAESADGVSGNYGLLDQIAALEWVRDNIAGFGGDPNRVTIFGESAGGEAVLNLMTSPRARGLFHRAIAQSPSDSGRWLRLNEPVLDFLPASEAGSRFAAAAVGDDTGQVARLRELPADALYDLYRERGDLGRHFYPAVDGVVLPSTPMTAFARNQQATVPLVIGYNADEASLFYRFMNPAGGEFAAPRSPLPGATRPDISPDEVRATFERSYPSPSHVDRLMSIYPGLSSLDRGAVERHGGDHMFGVHVDHASRMHAQAGLPVWRYHFRSVPPSKKQTAGAFHAAEIVHVFGSSLPLVPAAPDAHLLTRAMGDHWFAFAATGDPSFPGREEWPTYDPADPKHLVFDRPVSSVQPCPAQPGLDLMRERIDWLSKED
ncbi:MAG: carboxylesterase family protein [Actinomycetota bacterium]